MMDNNMRTRYKITQRAPMLGNGVYELFERSATECAPCAQTDPLTKVCDETIAEGRGGTCELAHMGIIPFAME